MYRVEGMTPGPWEKRGERTVHSRVSPNRTICVALIEGGGDQGTNAKAIAALPDLLEILSVWRHQLTTVDNSPKMAAALDQRLEELLGAEWKEGDETPCMLK